MQRIFAILQRFTKSFKPELDEPTSIPGQMMCGGTAVWHFSRIVDPTELNVQYKTVNPSNMSQFSPTIISNTKSYELFTSFQQNTEPNPDTINQMSNANGLAIYHSVADEQSQQPDSCETGRAAINTEWLVWN